MLQPICTVNLTRAESGRYDIPASWQAEFLGGSALAARLLFDQLTPDLDPLSPQAPLLFLNGPLSGTAGPAVGRFVVCARSPHTGLWGESNCGGFWGFELRRAGFDGLWLTGRAGQPVYLWIHDGQVELRPAAHLWGLDTYQTQAAVLYELGQDGKGTSIAAIGQAGEALVPYALILTDHGRVAGRTGMGAVMGSKNLKAVAVRGHAPIPVADSGAYALLRAEANHRMRLDPTSVVLRELGTAGVVDYFDYLAEMPKQYFQAANFPAAANVSGSAYSSSLLAGVSACHACVIACGRVVRLPEGAGAGLRRKGPEYETIVGFGPNLLIDDPIFITRMGELCDRYGMDSISLSNTIGLAFWLYQHRCITLEDTGGLELVWGSQPAVENLVHQAARRQGFGALVAQGARALGRHFGAEEQSVQVKGLEMAYHDPRGATGMALVYATSPIGASHNQSDYFLVDIGQVEPALGLKDYSRLGGAEKARNVAIHQDWRTVFDALVMCLFANVDPDLLLALVNTACGLDWALPDLLRCGERAFNLKRLINHRLGLRRSDDALPKAVCVPYPDEPQGLPAGFVPDFDAMLQAYYQARGWGPVSGCPLPEKLESLGLGWAGESSLGKEAANE